MGVIEHFKLFVPPLNGHHAPADTFGDPRANGTRKHMGIDMGAPANSPIYSVMDGTVERVGYDATAGNYVSVVHDNGLWSNYCHMIKKSTSVIAGQRIAAGTLVGQVGNTGNSVANHLHLGFKRNGTWHNPYPYIRSAYGLYPIAQSNKQGEHIAYLQTLLNGAGFDCGRADGIFGNNTHSAVMDFQRARGLTADGIVGQKTWDALDQIEESTPETGQQSWQLSRLIKQSNPYMRGEDVKNIQRALIVCGHSVGSCGTDGIYGNDSQRAVLAFQKAKGLTADGIVGKNTCSALGGRWEGK